MYKRILSLALLLISFASFAQSSKDNENSGDEYDGKAYFMTGLNYVSNNVYLGRKDTVVVPYISPYIGYMFKSGIYARALASFTSRPKTHLDLFTLAAGYEHAFGDHFYSGALFEKYFYNKNTVSVKSNIKSSAGIFGQYTNDWIEPLLTLEYNQTTAKKGDFIVGGSLDHVFSLVDDKLNVLPTLTMFAGTQRYYQEHKKQRETNLNGKKAKNILISGSDQFQALDYEISCQFLYFLHHWAFKLIPAYVIPINPSSITVGNQVLPEKISNTFILELDICYRY